MIDLQNYSFPGIRALNNTRTLDQYIERYREISKDPMYAHYAEKASKLASLRNSLDPKFPFYVLIDDSYDTLDRLEDILWKTLGPKHGVCSKEEHYVSNGYDTEHWVCPGIDINHAHYEEMWTGYSFWAKQYESFEAFFEENNKGPETYDHSHIGEWTVRWGVKTGYDAGIQLVCFRREKDLNDFIVKATLGPQFEIMEK